MKTSTKIIILYSTLILAGILMLFILAKRHAFKNEVWSVKSYTCELPDFSVVVLQDSTKCTLVVADSNRIDYRLPNDKPMKGQPAFVRNDTLFVTNTPTGNTWDVVVKSTSTTTVITSPGSCVRFEDPLMDKLALIGRGGEIFLENRDPKKNEALGNRLVLFVEAKAKTQLHLNLPFRQLNGNLVNSNLYNRYATTVNRQMDLNLKDSAQAEMSYCPAKLVVVKDSTSRLLIN